MATETYNPISIKILADEGREQIKSPLTVCMINIFNGFIDMQQNQDSAPIRIFRHPSAEAVSTRKDGAVKTIPAPQITPICYHYDHKEVGNFLLEGAINSYHYHKVIEKINQHAVPYLQKHNLTCRDFFLSKAEFEAKGYAEFIEPIKKAYHMSSRSDYLTLDLPVEAIEGCPENRVGKVPSNLTASQEIPDSYRSDESAADRKADLAGSATLDSNIDDAGPGQIDSGNANPQLGDEL